MVDILGNLLGVEVQAGNLHDTKGGPSVLRKSSEKHPTITGYSGDAGYRGTTVDYVSKTLNLTIFISQKIKDTFSILPKRWIVERTFAWLGKFRRLAKDFEILKQTAENIIRISMMKITLAKCVN